MSSFPKPEQNSINLGFMEASDPATYQRLIELGLTKEVIEKTITENESNKPKFGETNAPQMTNEDIDALNDSYQQMLQTDTTAIRESTIDIKLDPDRRRTTMYFRRRNIPMVQHEHCVKSLNLEHDLRFLEDNDILSNQTKEVLIEELQRTTEEREKSIDDITQTQVPEIANYKESFVETVQGSFTELPAASTNTKYIMTQYRADQAKETKLNVTLSMSPVNTGCAHFTCNPPAGQTGGSVS